MSTNPQQPGSTNRIDISDAAISFIGIGLVRFDGFSFELEDGSDNEEAVDNHVLIYDGRVSSSGDFTLFPDSPSVPRMKEAIKNRAIGTLVYAPPEADASTRHRFQGVRLNSFGMDDLDQGYMYNGDWEAAWVL